MACLNLSPTTHTYLRSKPSGRMDIGTSSQRFSDDGLPKLVCFPSHIPTEAAMESVSDPAACPDTATAADSGAQEETRPVWITSVFRFLAALFQIFCWPHWESVL